MKNFFIVVLAFLLATVEIVAQEKWGLEKCVAYAMANNISVKQADIQARIAALTLELNRAGQLPNLIFGANAGYNFGRSINPATNQFQNNTVFFNDFQLQTNVNLFNWFSQRHLVEASKLDLKASNAAIDKAANDIALNVAVAYLQTLLAHEQIGISEVQIKQTFSQTDQVRKRVNAGALPELNLIEVQAQLARDSATYITAVSTYQQNLIQLKALLNLDMAIPFDIEKPNVTSIPVESLADLQPAAVYQEALTNQPLQKVNQYRYDAALKNIQAAKASMYPTLSAFAGISSRYSSLFADESRITRTKLPGYQLTPGYIKNASGSYDTVVTDRYLTTVPFATYGKQMFDVNLGQAIGLNLSVPIFNNRQLRTNWERSKLNAQSIKLQLDQDNMALQADIYNAYTNAVNAQQRYVSAQKAVEASEKVVYYSQKRYDANLLPIFELLTNQNNLTRAKLDAAAAQYEFVFRMKLLEFYKGKGLKL